MIGTVIDYRLRIAFAADAVSRWGAVFRSPAGYGCSRLTAAGRAQYAPKSLGLAAVVPEADCAKPDHRRALPQTSTSLRALGPQ